MSRQQEFKSEKIRGERHSSLDKLTGGEAKTGRWDAFEDGWRKQVGREGRLTAGTTEQRLKSTKTSRLGESDCDALPNNSAGCECRGFEKHLLINVWKESKS